MVETNIPPVLAEIVERKKHEVKHLKNSGIAATCKNFIEEGHKSIGFSFRGESFYKAITEPRGSVPHLIAEHKVTSPSNKGKPYFRHGLTPTEPKEIAKIYQQSGAKAISVLTDSGFKGNVYHLLYIRQEVDDMSLLRKDFTIDHSQILEAKYFGANCVLLIASILEKSELKDFIQAAVENGLDCLVESHDIFELDKVTNVFNQLKNEEKNHVIFGINNRNLRVKGFPTNIETTLKLLNHVPEGYPIVTESGINTYEDVRKLSDPRINAMLVGTTLMKAPDIGYKVKELMGQLL